MSTLNPDISKSVLQPDLVALQLGLPSLLLHGLVGVENSRSGALGRLEPPPFRLATSGIEFEMPSGK